jgi:predicted TIM-barrel fold metal-dependent hydrolase
MIVDSHIHWPVGANDDPAAFLKVLDRYGTDRAVVSGWEVLMRPGSTAMWNDRLADFCRRSGGRLVQLATFYLADGPEAVREARRSLDKLGARGFKYHPWLQGESVFCETMYEICRLAASFRVPILFHDGTPAYSLSSQFAVLAGLFPETKFILGHGGILHFWEEAIEAARQYPNIRITLCGQHSLAMQAACDSLPVPRLLWGTDYVGPGGEEFIAYRRGLFDGLTLSPDVRAAILGDNPKRLFRLED